MVGYVPTVVIVMCYVNQQRADCHRVSRVEKREPNSTPSAARGLSYKKARHGRSVDLDRQRARAGDNIDESGKRARCFRIRGQHRDCAAGLHPASVFGDGQPGMFGDNGDPIRCRYWVPTNADTVKA